MSNDEYADNVALVHSSFVLRHSLVIRISSLVISEKIVANKK
jgi:hypothetical protein